MHESAEIHVIHSLLPLMAVLIPLAGMVLTAILSRRLPALVKWVSVLASAATFATVAMMYPAAGEGVSFAYYAGQVITPLGMSFYVDGLGFLVALISSFVWLAVSIYGIEYLAHEEDPSRFYGLMLLTLTGTVGVPLAGDFITLLIFFEIMSLSSYVLVVHQKTNQAYNAGNLYLYMGVFGGMALLTGIMLMYVSAGTVEIATGAALAGQSRWLLYLIAGLMILGFGIKAGMVPVHIWLPEAHPVAPVPASALLSGIMIKSGAYGIIRVVNMVFFSASPHGEAATHFTPFLTEAGNIGFVIIWIGIITMFFGVVMALIQENSKKMLACHSISQMGYILLGIGVAAFLGAEGGMGLAGSIFHIINHALFKSALFLVVGAVYLKTHQLNMYRLGGLWRKMPWAFIIGLIAAMGISGVPLFNGYASKTLLHHAILEAYHESGMLNLWVAERIFTITSAGTAASFIKLIYLTFLGPMPEKFKHIKGESGFVVAGMGIIAAVIVLIGVFPNLVLERLINPALSAFALDIDHLVGLNFFTTENLIAIALALGLGAMVTSMGLVTGIFHKSFPVWMQEIYLFRQMRSLAVSVWQSIAVATLDVVDLFTDMGAWFYRIGFHFFQEVDYRPGESQVFRVINFSNIDFDLILIMIMLVVILVLLFYLQFGLPVLAWLVAAAGMI